MTVGRLSLRSPLVSARLGLFNIAEVGPLVVGIDIQDDELAIGPRRLSRVSPALSGEDSAVEMPKSRAQFSAVLARQVVGKGMGCAWSAEALDPRSTEEVVDNTRVPFE
ncbi:hypothetical protein [Streptomyces sp. NPDC002122]|uniref:hypothetical protein n=1 Tax=Streptomyces sp. NPDC002122 TaxID=3154407 RepID=UPI00331DE0A6